MLHLQYSIITIIFPSAVFVFYKIAEGMIPAISPEDFLTPASKDRRQICPTRFDGCEMKNLLMKQVAHNTQGFTVPVSRTEQYRSSFFVRTVTEWNLLSETITASSALGRFA